MANHDFPTRIRDYQESDLPFCRDSFYKGAASSPEFIGMDQNIAKPGFRSRFDRIFEWADIRIICDANHEEPIFGWVAVTNLTSQSIIWWVYVKSGYRNFGFARDLIEATVKHDQVFYPWRSRASNALAISFNASFNPFVYEDIIYNANKKAVYI
jgi:GNAT superfamily N-acetyltransferase